MSLPTEPRQKMINIMYLVLTAILALNVSAEILNAFKTVDRSLMTSTGVAHQKSEDLFKSFERKIAEPKTKEKAERWLPVAQKAQKLADEMYSYIDALKLELKKEAQLHKNEEGQEVYKEDDLEAATRLLVSKAPEGKDKGRELYAKLASFKSALLRVDEGVVDSSAGKGTVASEVGPTLPIDLSIAKTNNAETKDSIQNWSFGYFHMTPAVAAITILSKFENDVRIAEAQVVEYCHRKIGEVEIVYDAFQGFAQSSTQYAMPGEELIITAGVGAFSKSAAPRITVDGVPVALKPDGSAEYKTTVGGSGSYSKKVSITYTRPDNTTATIIKDVKYTVGVPSGLVVSTDKTRVFYQDLENPLSVTGGGGDEKVNVTVTGAGVSSSKAGAGQYIVTCKSLGTATVVATDGKNTQKIVIPIKRVPDPTPKVGDNSGGPVPANRFRVQKGVYADLKDFIFEGVKYEVVSFTIACTGKGFEELAFAENIGAYFGAEAQQLLKRCQAGSTVVIDEIKVRGPGGTRTLEQNMSFTLQ